ncbi:MAG TPA: acetyl/propionyl/methylcrotonyl-CoA carboxylase subunit alpha [Candidatus Sulfotelmatobacter sp.]|nr:acetyl/propionyl/methylcrotonyl-CoA carboxylase subunit alpha [Candidatus Sulfotelmatobacter sp.]
MFKKILIANRGEIACRVMRTAKRMGIKTVAVYSEPDADALHVREADEAVAIGPAASSESYLNIARIVDAARRTGAEAVHPGYGFLSERTAFAEALAKARVAFIGPNPRAIAAMGDKIESKKLALAAKVSTVPGHVGVLDTPEAAIAEATKIGYPVMIKASAGGGGKGMRIAYNAQEVRDGLVSARSEAKSSFADDRVFIEKYIEAPRHIEIQVLGDQHGTILYLGERECSIQRRHQKVIEESPSPFLDPATRKAMGEQAVALAQAVGYTSAGTVEFIVDPQRNFYFLEMNTRLQVEHPVTEFVTGLDLVEWMIRIAAGEKLPFTQKQIKLTGWAVEARVYAEDPSRNFLPSIGRLTRYRPPVGEGVRVDTGVYEGAEISMHYDPMIAKLVTAGSDRAAAIATMQRALDAFAIRGPNHNIEFLAALMALPRFRAGDMSTNLIAEAFPRGFVAPAPDGAALARLLALAVARRYARERREATLSGQVPGRPYRPPTRWIARAEGVNHDAVAREATDGVDVELGGRTLAVRGRLDAGAGAFDGTIDGAAMVVQIDRVGLGERLSHGGNALAVQVMTERTAVLSARMPVREAADMSRFLLSPMPGLLVKVAVAEGDEVKAGEPLAIVEAMKMENVLRAERDGRIKQVVAAAGSSLAVDQVILEFA